MWLIINALFFTEICHTIPADIQEFDVWMNIKMDILDPMGGVKIWEVLLWWFFSSASELCLKTFQISEQHFIVLWK